MKQGKTRGTARAGRYGTIAGAAVAISSCTVMGGCGPGPATYAAAPLAGGGGSSGAAGPTGAGGPTVATSGASSVTHASVGQATTGAGGTQAAGPCAIASAFWATSVGFTSPTAEPLAAGLNELAYASTPHALSLVLRAGPGGLAGAVSATVQGQTGLDAFAVTEAPDFAGVSVSADTLAATSPQTAGHMHLTDQQGPVDVALEQLRWTAKVDPLCSKLWAVLDAQIPSSEAVHAWFAGDSMSFDFGALGKP